MIGDSKFYTPEELIEKLQKEREYLSGGYLVAERATDTAKDIQRAAFELWMAGHLSQKEFDEVKQECTPYLNLPEAKPSVSAQA